MKIILKIATIGILLMLMSCSASQLLRMAQKKDPSLFKEPTVITKIDTVEVVPVDFDFDQVRDSIVYLTQYDTVTQDSIRIEYLWNTKTNTVKIKADCPDCLEKTVTVTHPPILLEPTFMDKVKAGAFAGLIAGMLAFLALLFILSKKKDTPPLNV